MSSTYLFLCSEFYFKNAQQTDISYSSLNAYTVFKIGFVSKIACVCLNKEIMIMYADARQECFKCDDVYKHNLCSFYFKLFRALILHIIC